MNFIDVSVGILLNDTKVLLGKRPKTKPWAGWWEFPGGKINSGETANDALIRELKEELGITVTSSEPWMIRTHHFNNQPIRLHFFKINSWKKSPIALEHDELKWVEIESPKVEPLLPANQMIFQSLQLPSIYAITNMTEFHGNFFSLLERKIKSEINLIQIRERLLDQNELEIFSKKVLHLARQHKIKVLINANLELAKKIKADGVHLNSKQIYENITIPEEMIIGASCHSIEDLKQAEARKYNFALLSPVKKTLTHPSIDPMGWKSFQEIINQVQIPVYALGGMACSDIPNAFESGAVGIAAQRAIWT